MVGTYLNSHILAWPAPGWLQTCGQFWCTGGGYWCTFFPTGANLVQGWVWAVFCASAGRCTEIKTWCWKITFRCQKSIIWWKFGAENQFWGSEILMKFLEGFREVAGEAWRWWSHYLTQWVSFKTLAFFEQVPHPSVHRSNFDQNLTLLVNRQIPAPLSWGAIIWSQKMRTYSTALVLKKIFSRPYAVCTAIRIAVYNLTFFTVSTAIQRFSTAKCTLFHGQILFSRLYLDSKAKPFFRSHLAKRPLASFFAIKRPWKQDLAVEKRWIAVENREKREIVDGTMRMTVKTAYGRENIFSWTRAVCARFLWSNGSPGWQIGNRSGTSREPVGNHSREP